MNDETAGAAPRVGLLTFEYGSIWCGGMGTVVTLLARELRSQGFQPVVILPRSHGEQSWRHLKRWTIPYGQADVYDDDGVEVWLLSNAILDSFAVYPQPYEHTGIKKTDEYGERVADLLDIVNVDLLHLHDAYGYKCLWEARLRGIPTVYTVHRLHEDEPPLALAELVCFELCDIVTTVSHSYRSFCLGRPFGAGQVEVIHNGIDLNFWSEEALQPSLKPRPARRSEMCTKLSLEQGILVAYAGRLDRDQKGLHVLLEALSPLLLQESQLRLVLAGSGDEDVVRRVVAFANGHLGRVHFSGRMLTAEELRELFGAVDVLVIPSLYEPFGLVLVESMAMGAIPVATKTGGLEDALEHQQCGHLVPPGDLLSLRQAVQAAISQAEADEDATTAQRRAAVNLGSRFSAAAMARNYAALYGRALYSAGRCA